MRTDRLAEAVVARLKEKNSTLATAESCTGGGVGQILTAVPGSSAAYLGGVISYTNEVKQRLLCVPASVLEEHGAVSRQTAVAMAKGVQTLLSADFGISVTGLAGPDGDGSGKPVGLVYVAAAGSAGAEVREYVFPGTREEVRSQAITSVLQLLLDIL